VRCDHTEPDQVRALVERIGSEQDGRLDVLVNDVWGGDALAEWKPVWEHNLDNGLRLLRLAVDSHIITSHFALPLMISRRRGLVVEVTDGDPTGTRSRTRCSRTVTGAVSSTTSSRRR
jgi:NAD(P)-dependent dehydrogenase (short-subunit alcohol dehydrogenase family)